MYFFVNEGRDGYRLVSIVTEEEAVIFASSDTMNVFEAEIDPTLKKLWSVTVPHGWFEYDEFQQAVVWAETAEEAEAITRAAIRLKADEIYPGSKEELWLRPNRPVVVSEAPTTGVALVHWYAG